MSIAIGSDSLSLATTSMISSNSKTENLESKLKSGSSNDEELMDSCKEFESYLVEQVFKGMEKTVPQEEEKNSYMEQFGDTLYESYAKSITENQSLGIAQMLYDSMKRNT